CCGKGTSMKRTTTVTRKGRERKRQPFARPSTQVRRRGSGLKLESLEERIVLSITTKVLPPLSATIPVGLGAVYTTMSEQAHGVGLNTGSSTQYDPNGTSSPVTMADLQAYLQQLGAQLKSANPNPGTLPTQNPDHGNVVGPPGPLSKLAYVNPG